MSNLYEDSQWAECGFEENEVNLLIDSANGALVGQNEMIDVMSVEYLLGWKSDSSLCLKWEVDGEVLQGKILGLSQLERIFFMGWLRGWWKRASKK